MNNNKLRSLRRRRALLALTTFLGVGLAGVSAADIFVYESASGSKLITDHRRSEPGYRLVKIYKTDTNTDTPGASSWTPRPVDSPFDELIIETARTFELDPALIKAVMQVESAFDRYAISRKGASGLMQLMPGTADRYGVQSVFDPGQNVSAGARYLRDLLALFNGDTRLALAGYNAGENAVTRHGGIPPFAETRAYVDKVMDLYRKYQDRGTDQRRLTVADR